MLEYINMPRPIGFPVPLLLHRSFAERVSKLSLSTGADLSFADTLYLPPFLSALF
jgi:hypothetical protein